jgi:hypothetical protein
MQVCGDSEPQYGETERCIISYLPKSEYRTIEYPADEFPCVQLSLLNCRFKGTLLGSSILFSSVLNVVTEL